MHDIWNPWHGCTKCSEGCKNCYMYYLDKQRNQDGSKIYRTKTGFNYPIRKNKDGSYKIKSGEMIRVCMTSDFFLKEADPWRDEAWDIMRQRSDVIFFLLTKRPERVMECLPSDWGDGWENIFFNVTCENQKRTDERVPLLLKLPFKHKGIMCAPFIEEVSLAKYLTDGTIEQVICGGENYDGARPCDFEWVKKLHTECKNADVTFCFFETGTVFIKNGKTYRMPDKQVQSEMAMKSNMSYEGKAMVFNLTQPYEQLSFGVETSPYQPHYRKQCEKCGSKMICNGCSECGKCK